MYLRSELKLDYLHRLRSLSPWNSLENFPLQTEQRSQTAE